MNIKILPVGPYAVNCCFVLGSDRQCLVIDPGYDAAGIQNILGENNLNVTAILLTHGHVDHISELKTLHDLFPAPVYMHAEDEKWAFSPTNQLPPDYFVPEKPEIEFVHPETSDNWTIADQNFECIPTPGHTPGGVCYWFKEEDICFTGDTLFRGSCGRTDLPGGDSRILSNSLKKLASLPRETRIIAGHGPDSTIEYELKTNFFMQY